MPPVGLIFLKFYVRALRMNWISQAEWRGCSVVRQQQNNINIILCWPFYWVTSYCRLIVPKTPKEYWWKLCNWNCNLITNILGIWMLPFLKQSLLCFIVIICERGMLHVWTLNAFNLNSQNTLKIPFRHVWRLVEQYLNNNLCQNIFSYSCVSWFNITKHTYHSAQFKHLSGRTMRGFVSEKEENRCAWCCENIVLNVCSSSCSTAADWQMSLLSH